MKNFLKKYFLFFFLHFGLFAEESIFPWVVYYGSGDIDQKKFELYNPIILERDDHPPLAPLLKQKKQVLGYLALGEIEEYRHHFARAKKEGLLIQDNPDWPGSWAVDVRRPEWERLVMDDLIPEILNKGFTGLFLDQLDVPIELEEKNPQKFSGMKKALIHLLKAIRKTYPELRIMMNRAYEILPYVGNLIDYELAETLYTTYNFEKKEYSVRPESEFEWQLLQLNKARKAFPHLVLFSLDYWKPEDKKMYKKIYSKERSQCLRPYVTTILLDQITPEP